MKVIGFSTTVVIGLIYLSSTGHAIGQSLEGQPIGHQEHKDHSHDHATQNSNPYSDVVKVVEKHSHMDDYDKFIKEQSDPQSHHHIAASTAAAPPTTASLTETTHQQNEKFMTSKILDPMETTSTQELHKLAQLEKEKNKVDMTEFEARRQSKEERRQDSMRYSDALAKYEEKVLRKEQHEAASSTLAKSAPSMTVAALRSQSFAEGSESEGKENKKTSLLNVSTTQAYILIGLFVFLLIIALIIFGLSYVANMMMEMQRKHEAQIIELQSRQNNSNQQNVADDGGNLQLGDNLRHRGSRNEKKNDAYGIFEDEINMSKDNFDTTSRGQEYGSREP